MEQKKELIGFSLTLNDLRNFMKENNINNNFDTNKPIESLGIFKIRKFDKNHWIIKMKGPKSSMYEKGVFEITFSFPNNYPNIRPEIRIKNKIYHLQVSPSNGHICFQITFEWNPTTSISELFTSIYLFLSLKQEPNSPYSGEMAREYTTDFFKFVEKAESWVSEYASPTEEDLKLIKEMEGCSVKTGENKNQFNCDYLDKENYVLKSEITILKDKLLRANDLINELKIQRQYINNFIETNKLKEEINELKLEKEKNKSKKNNYSLDDIFVVYFFSLDQKINNYGIKCLKTDTFAEIEEKLYQKYEEYRETNNSFVVKGRGILRFKTISENNINDGDFIQLIEIK